MTVYITCPYCHEKNIIEASVNVKDTSDVVDYPEECPNCKHEVTNDMIADLQYQAQQDLFEAMLLQIGNER